MSVRDYIAENRNVGKTAQLYMDAYAGTDMTADEIWEELICDSLGDMNIFSETLGEEAAQEYLTETRRAVEAVQRESAGGRAPPIKWKMSRETGYWFPKLTTAEWNLMNYKMDRAGVELDDATYWFYSSERGTRVFCIYGIGDGTVNTPLYAVGGKTAEVEAAKFERFLEAFENDDIETRKTFDRWLEDLRSE